MRSKRIMAVLLGGILILNSGMTGLAAEPAEKFAGMGEENQVVEETEGTEEENTEETEEGEAEKTEEDNTEETGEEETEKAEEDNIGEGETTQGDILTEAGEETVIEGNIPEETEGQPSLDDLQEELLNELEQNENLMSVETTEELPETEEIPANTVTDGQPLVISTSGTVALTADVTVPSVTITHTSGILDLAGHTLTVTGDVIQQGGTISVNRGKLIIGGNFEQKEGYSSLLKMQYTNDAVTVGGSYKTASTANHSGNLKAGTLTISGDLIVGAGSDYNFCSNVDHKVIFKGQGPHLISFSHANYKGENRSRINDLTVESGQITVNDYLSVNKLESDMNIISVNGAQLCTDNMHLNGHTVTINSNLLQTGGEVNLEGGNLTVNGDVTQQSGSINVNKGSLTVKGSFEQKEGFQSRIRMRYTNDAVTVGESYKTASTADHSGDLTAGTITISGDLIVGAGSDYNFNSNVDHKVIFKGQRPHLISFSSADNTKGRINDLTVESGQITVNDYLSVNKLESDLTIMSVSRAQLHTANMHLNGHTVTLNGNLLQTGGVVDLEEGNLTINGNITQQSGTINVNKGSLAVKGSFEQKEGYASLLKMQSTNDRVTVEGDYTTASTSNSSGQLTAGLLTIKGNFTEGAGNNYNFCATGTHQVKLNGDGIQRISFANYPSSHFNRLHVTKPIASGYTFSPYPCWNKVSGYIYTYAGFDDVPSADGNWKHDNVKYVYEHGVMNGISGTNDFRPDGELTRAMFATVLYRMAGEPEVSFSNKFTDVKSGQYYSNAVIWASNNNIVSGYGDGSYGVNNNITREQIAKMLYEFGKGQGYDMSVAAPLNDFTDVQDVNGWAVGYMQWAVGAGMISGKPNGDGTNRLDPKGEATRAECAKMLSMFMKKYAE